MRKPASAPRLPDPGEGKRGEAGHLAYLLRQAATVLRTRMDRALAELGVTHPQFVVMTMLAAYPGHSNAELARIALLTPQTVSVIVANLERAGLVSRQAHAVHGRIQHLVLTAQGQAVLTRAKRRIEGVERSMAQGLSGAEEEMVRRWLVRVALGAGS
jgi:DNA-binding MarR family transcriptional regulator